MKQMWVNNIFDCQGTTCLTWNDFKDMYIYLASAFNQYIYIHCSFLATGLSSFNHLFILFEEPNKNG